MPRRLLLLMAADGGGSFWATFGGGAAQEVSPLEEKLQTPNCSIEGLLDEEDVIQEFKTGNPRLVARLSEPDAIQALMQFITLEPAADAPCARCFRYPFVAVELITCGPLKFLELLVNPESCEAMKLLWGFLSSTAPSEVNPVLAGYFARTAAALMSKHQKEVLEYLRQRGPEQLLTEFLDRIHLRSLAELFARLLCAEGEAQVVFPTGNLVAQLLEKWQDSDAGSDAQEHITLIIAELLSQKDVLCWIEDLTHQLTSPATVRFLIEHIFRRAGGVPPAMSLLTTVIVHTTAGIKDGMTEVCASTPTLSPLSPPSPALVAGEEDMTLDEGVVGEASTARAATLSPPSTPNTTLRSTTSEEWMERRRADLLREVASHFPRLREGLDAGLAQATEDPSLSMPQGRISPVGGTTLEVISLIATVARSGLDVILEALLRHQLLPRCIEVFFRHPWSSLLHNSVKQLLLEVLSGTDPLRQELIRQLLNEGRLAHRLASEYAAEAAWKAAPKKPRHSRTGYMGHLYLIACELRDYGNNKSVEVWESLSATPGWAEVLEFINEIQGLHKEQLGGGVPASDRGLASTKAPSETEPSEPPPEQFAACPPSFTQRVMAGRKNYLTEEPSALQDTGGTGSSESGAPGLTGGAGVPNGQDFAFAPPSSPPGLQSPEDAFDPQGASKAPSSSSWASFPDAAPPPASTDFASFPAFPEAPAAPAVAPFAPQWPTPPAESQRPPSRSRQPPPPASWVAQFDFDEPREEPAGARRADASRSLEAQFLDAPPDLATGTATASHSRESVSPPPTPTPLATSLGAENLFALIGDVSPNAPPIPSAPASTVPKQPSAVSSPPSASYPGDATRWPAPPAPQSPWGTAEPPKGQGMEGFANFPSSGPAAPVDGQKDRWLADFDPLAKPQASPALGEEAVSGMPFSASGGSELAFLDIQWQQTSQKSTASH